MYMMICRGCNRPRNSTSKPCSLSLSSSSSSSSAALWAPHSVSFLFIEQNNKEGYSGKEGSRVDWLAGWLACWSLVGYWRPKSKDSARRPSQISLGVRMEAAFQQEVKKLKVRPGKVYGETTRRGWLAGGQSSNYLFIHSVSIVQNGMGGTVFVCSEFGNRSRSFQFKPPV